MGCVFSASKPFLEMREQVQSHRGQDRENRAGVLECRPPVHLETMSHFQPCDSRRCHVTNTCLGYPSLVDISGRS